MKNFSLSACRKAKGKSDAEVVEMMKVHLAAIKKQYGQ